MDIHALDLTVSLLGLLSLGMFVGFVLGWTLVKATSMNVKIAAAVISAALAGAPLVFMRGLSFQRWMYPIGLLLGLAWTRMFSALASKFGNKNERLYAWIDMIAIVGATLVVFLCSAFASWIFVSVHSRFVVAQRIDSVEKLRLTRNDGLRQER